MVERTEAIEAFRADTDKSVMLIQISAETVGMNLQFASRVYFTSPHYNPSVEIQAIARAHRLGQERPVKVVKVTIVDDGFIEEEILAKQNLKREVMARCWMTSVCWTMPHVTVSKQTTTISNTISQLTNLLTHKSKTQKNLYPSLL